MSSEEFKESLETCLKGNFGGFRKVMSEYQRLTAEVERLKAENQRFKTSLLDIYTIAHSTYHYDPDKDELKDRIA